MECPQRVGGSSTSIGVCPEITDTRVVTASGRCARDRVRRLSNLAIDALREPAGDPAHEAGPAWRPAIRLGARTAVPCRTTLPAAISASRSRDGRLSCLIRSMPGSIRVMSGFIRPLVARLHPDVARDRPAPVRSCRARVRRHPAPGRARTASVAARPRTIHGRPGRSAGGRLRSRDGTSEARDRPLSSRITPIVGHRPARSRAPRVLPEDRPPARRASPPATHPPPSSASPSCPRRSGRSRPRS